MSTSARARASDELSAQAAGVHVELGGQPVLHGVDLQVRAGETVALMGGNGSGKSTLVRSLVGLVPLASGEVRLFDTPVRRFRRWRDVGYVPQRSVLGLAGATVAEVVASGRLARRRPFAPQRAADRAAVDRALATVRLGARAKEEMTTLSGGQQQRVLIARALAGEPRLLVLDEPVAGVDLEHQQVLADVFSHLVERGTAILVVLHELGPIAGLVDRAVTLRDGRVVGDGPLPDHAGRLDHRHPHGHETDEPTAPLRAWPHEPVADRRREARR